MFRRAVSAALQPIFKKRELVRSLGRCDPRTARFRASQLWIVTERMFQMFVKFKLEEGDEPDLINPDQLKLFVDAMLVLNRYNDEYVIARYGEAIEKNNSIAHLLLNYEVWAKRARADRLKNNISGVVEEIQNLAEQLDMPIRQGSMSERLIGRELLRAQADYYEQYADQERKERELPDQENLRARSLDKLGRASQ